LTQPTDDTGNRPLPDRGLQILTDLITHQDSTTWTALSVFGAAEFLLFALYVQALPAANIYVLGTLGTFGLATTLVSFFIVERSNRYLAEYLRLAKQRCHPRDLEIFDITLPRIRIPVFGISGPLPTASRMVKYMHGFFLIVWLTLSIGYFLFLAIRLALVALV
jgi:hypothetical protein